MIVVSPQSSFVPLLRLLAKQKVEIISAHGQFTQSLANADIPSKSLQDAVGAQSQAYLHTSYKESLRVITDLLADPLDTSLLGLSVQQWMADELPAYLYGRVPEMVRLIMALDAAKPQLVLVHNDVEPVLRLMATWAKVRGVPCVHVPHAIYLDTSERGDEGADIHDIVTASDIAVAGPYQTRWYLSRAKQQGKRATAHYTGLPQFDRLAKPEVDRVQAARLLNINPNLPVLVYFGTWRQDTNLLGCHDGIEEAYAAVLHMAKALPDVQMIVKTHPRGNNAPWHAEQAQEKGVRCLVTDQHLDVCMNVADIALSYGPSNVLLEAACVPGIRLMAIGQCLRDDVEVIKIPNEPTLDSELLVRAVQCSLATGAPDMTMFKQKYFGPAGIDGKSSERIADLILGLLPKAGIDA